jgi:hypothetical protein
MFLVSLCTDEVLNMLRSREGLVEWSEEAWLSKRWDATRGNVITRGGVFPAFSTAKPSYLNTSPPSIRFQFSAPLFTPLRVPKLRHHVGHKDYQLRHARLKRRLRVQDPAFSSMHRRHHQESAGPFV